MCKQFTGFDLNPLLTAPNPDLTVDTQSGLSGFEYGLLRYECKSHLCCMAQGSANEVSLAEVGRDGAYIYTDIMHLDNTSMYEKLITTWC